MVKLIGVHLSLQDAASKGVGLVYDSSSEDQREQLVRILF
jgi:hypothetical protein